MKIVSLHIHPVKGMRAVNIDRADVVSRGLAGDRRWMVTDEEGGFLTQRTCSALAKIDAVYEGAALRLSDGETECVVDPPAGGDRRQVTVWKDQVSAAAVGQGASDWLCGVLGSPARLFYMDDEARRMTSGNWGDTRPVSFADGYPLLVATTASLAALNEAIAANGGEGVSMARFRPNIVIDGADPWAEDFWKVIRIGGVEIELVKPCDRCVVTTLDPATGEKLGREPLKTLNKLRRSAHPDLSGAVLFGWNAAPLGEGVLAVGDAVEIIERRPEGWPLA